MSIKALGALQLPSQKEWAAGLGGILAFGVIAACNHFGYPLGDETDSLLVVVLPPLISKLVPPSAADVLTHVNDAIVEAGVIAGKLTPPAQIVANDPANTLVLQPAQLVAAPAPAPSWQSQLMDDLVPLRQPTRSGVMADPAVVLQPKIDPPPAPAPVPGYDPPVAAGAAPVPHYDPPKTT
jgi:hypothetical protein